MSEMQMSEKARKARDKLRQTLKENPNLRKAFKETLDEMSKPENVKKMADDICRGMDSIKKVLDVHNKSRFDNFNLRE